MSASLWIEWTRTRLQPQEGQELLTALTSQQKAHLLERDYVWVEGVGVLWKPPDGDLLRRARFTHGIHFQTQRGEFYIDSEGSAHEISDHCSSRPRRAEATAGESSHEADGGQEHPLRAEERSLKTATSGHSRAQGGRGALQQVLRHRDPART